MNLEYNSQREQLIIPEYGRNIQKLLKTVRSVEDKEQRQLFVEMIVDLMGQMQPNSRNAKDFNDKLWNHVFRIAGYDLDVTPPDDVTIVPLEKRHKPAKPGYPQGDNRFKHYGINVKHLIEKAVGMEDPEKQQLFARVIAAYMKLAYKTWNTEHYINDDFIKADLKAMSKGRLIIPDDVAIETLHSGSSRSRKRSNGKGRSKSGKGRRRR